MLYAADAELMFMYGAARRRMASSKMKRMKQSGCKDQEELDEDNEELFAELGIKCLLYYLCHILRAALRKHRYFNNTTINIRKTFSSGRMSLTSERSHAYFDEICCSKFHYNSAVYCANKKEVGLTNSM